MSFSVSKGANPKIPRVTKVVVETPEQKELNKQLVDAGLEPVVTTVETVIDPRAQVVKNYGLVGGRMGGSVNLKFSNPDAL